MLKALTFLHDLEEQKHPDLTSAPMEVVPSSWKRLVAPKDQPVDRRYYTLCVLERLHEALRRHDVFVEESTRWGDPRAKLLSGEHWERVRPTICQSLGRKVEPKMEFDEAYRTTAARFPQPGVRLEKVKNKAGQELDSLVLTGLDKVEEQESLRLLRHRVARRNRWSICRNSCWKFRRVPALPPNFRISVKGARALTIFQQLFAPSCWPKPATWDSRPWYPKGFRLWSAIGCSMCSRIISGPIPFPAPMHGWWTIKPPSLWRRHGVVERLPVPMGCALSFL